MKISRAFALIVLLASAAGVFAQDSTVQVTNLNSPAVVQKSLSKAVWLKAEVVHADRNTIVVREEGNHLAIHTFTYGPALKDRMEAIADQGGFQSGDRVKILYKQGQTVALKIHGKPTKAS
jgi:hypothetical protein